MFTYCVIPSSLTPFLGLEMSQLVALDSLMQLNVLHPSSSAPSAQHLDPLALVIQEAHMRFYLPRHQTLTVILSWAAISLLADLSAWAPLAQPLMSC